MKHEKNVCILGDDTMSNWRWPQWIMAVILLYRMIDVGFGKYREDDFIGVFVSVVITVFLAYMLAEGGFW